MVGDSPCYLKSYELSNLYACKITAWCKQKINTILGLGKKISTNVYHAGGKTILPFFVKSRCKGKNEPNFDDVANCFCNISNEWNNYMNPQHELLRTLLMEGFFIQYFWFYVITHLHWCIF